MRFGREVLSGSHGQSAAAILSLALPHGSFMNS